MTVSALWWNYPRASAPVAAGAAVPSMAGLHAATERAATMTSQVKST